MNAASTTAVDFSPVISVLMQLAAAALLAAGTVAVGFLTSWLSAKAKTAGIEVTDAMQAQWNQGLQRALGFAVERVPGLTADMLAKGNLSTDLKNPLLANAAQYAVIHFPDVLKQVGILGSDGRVDQDLLNRALESRMGMIQVSTATAPATIASATSPAPTTATAS